MGAAAHIPTSSTMLYLVSYGAGNVRSLANAITLLGYEFKWVEKPEDIDQADQLIFPGVGAYGQAMNALREKGYAEPLARYIASGKPYFGICIGMQTLFMSSEEAPVPGLGIIPSSIKRFKSDAKAVPHMGWNGAIPLKSSPSPTKADEVKKGVRRRWSFVLLRPLVCRPVRRASERLGFDSHPIRRRDLRFVGAERQRLCNPIPPGEVRQGGSQRPPGVALADRRQQDGRHFGCVGRRRHILPGREAQAASKEWLHQENRRVSRRSGQRRWRSRRHEGRPVRRPGSC